MDKMEHEKLVIADLNTLNVFKFVDAESNGQKELIQAQEYLENQAKSLKALIADCQRPDFRNQWEESLQIRKNHSWSTVNSTKPVRSPKAGDCMLQIFPMPRERRKTNSAGICKRIFPASIKANGYSSVSTRIRITPIDCISIFAPQSAHRKAAAPTELKPPCRS